MTFAASRRIRSGFSTIELITVMSIAILMLLVASAKIRSVREQAQTAKDEANAHALQSACEKSLVVCPDILTNNSVEIFARGVYRKGLVRAPLTAQQTARIRVKRGTSILDHNARFVLAP